MSGATLSSVAYKKGNWMRYTLWGIAAVCIVALTVAFINMMSEASAGYSIDDAENILSPEKSSSEGSNT